MKLPEILSQLDPNQHVASVVMGDGFFYCRVTHPDGTKKIIRQRWDEETQTWLDIPRESMPPKERKPRSMRMFSKGLKNPEIANLFGVNIPTITSDTLGM